MRRRTACLCLLGLLCLLAGCAAADNRAVYAPREVRLDVAAKGPVALGVKDSREEVVSGDRRATFIGFQRSLYGIPFAVQTRSGRPFVQELAELIAEGLEADGVEVETVALSPSGPREAAISALAATGRPRLLLFEVVEWWGDTYVRTTLHYQVSLAVLDGAGRELARATAAGEDEIGGRQRPERRTLQAATDDIVQSLLSAREVAAALSGQAPAPGAARRCTVEQILKMREAGLAEQQIEAACGEDTE
jgi:hypothetical protein